MPSFINYNNKQELSPNEYTKLQISEALYLTETKNSRKIESLTEGLNRTTSLKDALDLFENKLVAMNALSATKQTYSGTLYEGQFSWMTQDTGAQIGSEKENTIEVWMYDNKGNQYYEKGYDGYGEFGGMDYYELLARMNGYTDEDLEDKKILKSIRVMGKGSMRDIGIALAFENKLKTRDKGGDVLFPALVADGRYNWKRHNFKQEAESDPNQSWFQEEEYDDYEDDEDYEQGWYESFMTEAQKVNEWGSSDQSIFLDAMHKDAGKPKKMPSPFDSKLRQAAEDAVDFYWEDWDEYKSDRDGLVDDAVRSYLRKYFKKDFDMMVKMFEPMKESLSEASKVYEEAVLENAVRDLHFETDPEKAEELKIELGASQGEVTRRKQIEGGEYSLRRFRKEIKYDTTGEDLGVFKPGSYMAATSKLGDGPHKKAVKKVKWNQKKYNQWLEDVASNDGWRNAYDMAQNAKHEPGLLDWAKKEFRGEDVMQRIQWDIEAFAESVETKKLTWDSLKESLGLNEGRSINKISKEHSAVVLDMANTVKEWKVAEGDRKTDLLEKLRGLNNRKAELEKELDQAVAGKDSEVELALSETETIQEKAYNKKSLMKAMKGDDGMIQLGDGQEYVIYAYGNGNDENDAMWGEDSIFALDQDGGEHEIKYSDIVSYNESVEPESFEYVEESESAEKGLKAIPAVLSWDIEQFLKKQKDAKKLTKGSFTDLVQALHSRGFEDRLNGANLRNFQAVVKKHIKESVVGEGVKGYKVGPELKDFDGMDFDKAQYVISNDSGFSDAVDADDWKPMLKIVQNSKYKQKLRKFLIHSDEDMENFAKWLSSGDHMKSESTVTEAKNDGNLDTIADYVQQVLDDGKSFMDIGKKLKGAYKYDFSTGMMPMYIIPVSGNKIVIINKKYVENGQADRVVGDIAIGLMESVNEQSDDALILIQQALKGMKNMKASIKGDNVIISNKAKDEFVYSLNDGGDVKDFIATIEESINLAKKKVESLDESLRNDLKKFIKKNQDELDRLADGEQWEQLYLFLYTEFDVEPKSDKAEELKDAFDLTY